MESPEPDNIINEDWRLQAITTLAEDFSFPNGPIHKKGAVVVLTAQTKFNKKNISFGLPNVTAMFLDFSNKLWQESEQYFKNESNFIEPLSKFMPVNTLGVSSNELLFDALEKRMGAIVFAYSAIESFANQVIPEGYIFKQTRSDKKYTEEYDRNQIENYLSLDLKLDQILPGIFNVKSPKGKGLWNQYSNLKKIRDRIIHLKTNDTKSTSPEVKTIWTELLDIKAPNWAVESKKIIDYYHNDKLNRPRWLKKVDF